MKFGIHLPQFGRIAGPEAIQRAAVRAEELGFDDVWASDHLAAPAQGTYVPSHFYEPVITLTWAAAATSRVGLGTSVLVLGLRHPVHLAKELATLDLLSGGRLVVGAGVGWLKAEFAALGHFGRIRFCFRSPVQAWRPILNPLDELLSMPNGFCFANRPTSLSRPAHKRNRRPYFVDSHRGTPLRQLGAPGRAAPGIARPQHARQYYIRVK